MYPNRGGPGQDQRHWEQPPQPHPVYYQNGQPPHGQPALSGNYAYPPQQQHQPTQIPQIRPDRPEMATLHPQYHQQPDNYRLPAPANFYPPQDPYRSTQAAMQNMNQSAPRQRTAIACKYCRRRKIRCSGFENSEDGRCSNCVRFSQECIFSPVSAQTQAFVPAQAVYGRGARNSANGPQLYGAYGQPLANQNERYPPPHPQQGYTLPSPTGTYPGTPGQPYPQQPYPQQQYPQPPYPQQPYEQNPQAVAGRRRTRDEPLTPTLPPPNPGQAVHLATHVEPGSAPYAYPDPTAFPGNGPASPASSNASYQSHPTQPYYAPQPPRRASPGSIFPYDPSRNSSSPHIGQPVTYAYGPGHPGQPGLQPNHHQAAPVKPEGRTPPPQSATSDHGANRNGINIKDIVSDGNSNGQGERSTTDNDMVSALNRTSRR